MQQQRFALKKVLFKRDNDNCAVFGVFVKKKWTIPAETSAEENQLTNFLKKTKYVVKIIQKVKNKSEMSALASSFWDRKIIFF